MKLDPEEDARQYRRLGRLGQKRRRRKRQQSARLRLRRRAEEVYAADGQDISERRREGCQWTECGDKVPAETDIPLRNLLFAQRRLI